MNFKYSVKKLLCIKYYYRRLLLDEEIEKCQRFKALLFLHYFQISFLIDFITGGKKWKNL